ncbi:MAG: hypothetical protein R2797_03075 [Gelidibacter sp.]
MKLFYLICSLAFFVGCNSQSNKTINEVSDQEKDSERITPKDIESLKFTDYVLSPEASQAVVNWQRYQELMTQMEFLKKADFSFFGGKNELLMNFLKDLQSDIPPSVATPAIKERLIALETKLLKLHSTLKLSNVKKKEMLSNIKELLVATSNLHLQINKKFELESQVIENPNKHSAAIDSLGI